MDGIQVITIEANAFKRLEGMFETLLTQNREMAEENKRLKDNALMSVADVCEFTGYGEAWVLRNKDKIGFSQPTGDLRFFKDDVIAYFKNSNHYIKTK